MPLSRGPAKARKCDYEIGERRHRKRDPIADYRNSLGYAGVRATVKNWMRTTLEIALAVAESDARVPGLSALQAWHLSSTSYKGCCRTSTLLKDDCKVRRLSERNADLEQLIRSHTHQHNVDLVRESAAFLHFVRKRHGVHALAITS